MNALRNLPIGDWLRITGKGGKIREVPVLAAVAEAVADYVASCPFDDGNNSPLFVSARGNALGARAAQRLVEGLRVQLNLPCLRRSNFCCFRNRHPSR